MKMKKILLAILSMGFILTLLGCESGMEATPSPVTPDAEEPAESVTPGETATTDPPEETIILPQKSTGVDPAKEYGLVFYLGDDYEPEQDGIYSIAPAGTEDWVYLDIAEECCEQDVNDWKTHIHGGCCRVFKCFAEVDGSISTKWRLRVEFVPETDGDTDDASRDHYSCYIIEDVIIVGDDTLLKSLKYLWFLDAVEDLDVYYMTHTRVSLVMRPCELCPPEWEEYQTQCK